jgi:hypothetical protein
MQTRQPAVNNQRAAPAAVREIPQPVKIATYAATQSGHLGIAASITLGMSQPAIRRTRRHRKLVGFDTAAA